METILAVFFAFYMLPCIALIVMLYIDFKNRPAHRREPVQVEHAAAPGTTTISATPGPDVRRDAIQAMRLKANLVGVKGRIISAYLDGLEALGGNGVTMTPPTTLSEFLEGLPTDARRPFTELTSLAEIALYSTHKLNEDTAAKAERLAAGLKNKTG